MNSIPVYVETGKKRTFVAAVDWPGWCRSAGDEPAALQTLAAYAPRYAPVAAGAGLALDARVTPAAFTVVERLMGNATTDFGTPGGIPAVDASPVDAAELARLQALLTACWQAFDGTVAAATGRALARGPRGGGRELDAIVSHVLEAEGAYLERVGFKLETQSGEDLAARQAPGMRLARAAELAALAAAAAGAVAAVGPRGGRRWPARYFARRAAWHVLDHAWEIEDRSA